MTLTSKHSSFQIYLHSRDAAIVAENRYTFDMTHLLPLAKSDHVCTLKVAHAQIPYTFYSIDIHNNQLYLYATQTPAPVAPISVSVPPGNYSVEELLKVLNDGIGYEALKCNFKRGRVTATFQHSMAAIPVGNDIWEVLGFVRGDFGSMYFSANTPREADYSINVNPISCVNIHCANIRTRHIRSDKSVNVLCRVPLMVCRGCIQLFDPNGDVPTRVMDQQDNLDLMTLYFTDEDGRVLNFNGIEWSLTMQIDYYESVSVSTEQYTAIRESFRNRQQPNKNLMDIYNNSLHAWYEKNDPERTRSKGGSS